MYFDGVMPGIFSNDDDVGGNDKERRENNTKELCVCVWFVAETRSRLKVPCLCTIFGEAKSNWMANYISNSTIIMPNRVFETVLMMVIHLNEFIVSTPKIHSLAISRGLSFR